jgi:hypothetical protein
MLGPSAPSAYFSFLSVHSWTPFLPLLPKTFRRVERVSTIYDSLASTEHDCFPVLNAEDGNVLVGTVLRKALCVILQVGGREESGGEKGTWVSQGCEC